MSASIRASQRLIILADGGALSDYNDRLGYENSPKKDFSRIPDAVMGAFEEKVGPVDCPLESRIFCTVVSEKAQTFLSKMGQTWTVRTFPLSFAKYERVPEGGGDKHRFRLRFHAYLGYALGLMVGAHADRPTRPVVAVVSDDPHLIPCMSDAQASGIGVRLVWWESSISEEVSYLAARNHVKTVVLAQEDTPAQIGPGRDSILRQLVKIDPSS